MRPVVPFQVAEWPVALLMVLARVKLLQPLPELEDEIQFAPARSRRFHRLMVPLQKPLGIGEAAVLLCMRRSREEEDLRADLFGFDFAAHNLRRLTPEIGRFGQLEIAHHQPIECTQAFPL